ncbi:inositol monophosphatase family protein [Brevibacillus laterosporus]|nr:inositol monophosphatase family protein [Brevibacillus laterosporus]
MSAIDIRFCEELLRRVGTGLYENLKKEYRSTTVEDLFQQFEESNRWSTFEIKEALAKKYPHILWSDLEFAINRQNCAEFQGEYWVCDAIDGAVQFLQGIYSFAITLCLIRNNQPVLSFVYDPSHQEFFHAIANEGAYLNGKRIGVAQKQKLQDSIIATTPPSYAKKDEEVTALTFKGFNQMTPKVFAVRMLGSVSLQLAYVASGRLDGYYEFGYDFYNWIAGALLVQEARGVVTDSRGKNFTWGTFGIIAANNNVQQKMQNQLRMVL